MCNVNGAHVKPVQEYELPYPLQKMNGETEDAWALLDGKRIVVLKLRNQREARDVPSGSRLENAECAVALQGQEDQYGSARR